MRLEYSNKGHPDSDSCIVLVRSSLRVLKRDATIASSILIFSDQKKPRLSDLTNVASGWSRFASDSRGVTGITGLDNDGELVSADYRRDASILDSNYKVILYSSNLSVTERF